MLEKIAELEIIETDDITTAIDNMARRLKTLSSNLDFDIEQVATHVILSAASDLTTNIVLNHEPLPEDFFYNPAIKIKQVFKIKIKKNTDELKNFRIVADETNCKVKAVFKKDFFQNFKQDNTEKLYEEINKKLAISKFIVYHFEGNLRNTLDEVVESQAYTLGDDDIEVTVSELTTFYESIDDKIDFIYQKKLKDEKDDLYESDSVKEVDVGKLLIEYTKPKNGRNGRDCQGKFLEARKPGRANAPLFKYDDTISLVDDDDTIKYYANKYGYVEFTNNYLRISDSLSVNSINAKDTGSIKNQKDGEVKINVVNENPEMDAIGPSMTVKVTQLSVTGNVAENAKIQATDVDIQGMTHATSHIEASMNAKIKNHRGDLKTQFAEIENLEGGRVRCEIANIKHAKSGTIIAKKVFVEHMDSNCKISASELIQVDGINGENNDIYITPLANTTSKEQIDLLQNKISDIQAMLKKNSTDLRTIITSINSSKETIEKIKAANQSNNKTHQDILQRYKSLIEKAKALQVAIEDKKVKISRLEKELARAQGTVLQAKIFIATEIKGKQTIRFHAPDGKDYFFANQANMPFLSLTLHQNPNGSYSVI